MAKILINDILVELNDENKRLLNENNRLLSENKNLSQLLVKYRKCLLNFHNLCECNHNSINSLLIECLESDVKQKQKTKDIFNEKFVESYLKRRGTPEVSTTVSKCYRKRPKNVSESPIRRLSVPLLRLSSVKPSSVPLKDVPVIDLIEPEEAIPVDQHNSVPNDNQLKRRRGRPPKRDSFGRIERPLMIERILSHNSEPLLKRPIGRPRIRDNSKPLIRRPIGRPRIKDNSKPVIKRPIGRPRIRDKPLFKRPIGRPPNFRYISQTIKKQINKQIPERVVPKDVESSSRKTAQEVSDTSLQNESLIQSLLRLPPLNANDNKYDHKYEAMDNSNKYLIIGSEEQVKQPINISLVYMSPPHLAAPEVSVSVNQSNYLKSNDSNDISVVKIETEVNESLEKSNHNLSDIKVKDEEIRCDSRLTQIGPYITLMTPITHIKPQIWQHF